MAAVVAMTSDRAVRLCDLIGPERLGGPNLCVSDRTCVHPGRPGSGRAAGAGAIGAGRGAPGARASRGPGRSRAARARSRAGACRAVAVPANEVPALVDHPVAAFAGCPRAAPPRLHALVAPSNPSAGRDAVDHEPRVVHERADAARARVGDVGDRHLDLLAERRRQVEGDRLPAVARPGERVPVAAGAGGGARLPGGEVVRQERVELEQEARPRTPPATAVVVPPSRSGSVVQSSWPAVWASTITWS